MIAVIENFWSLSLRGVSAVSRSCFVEKYVSDGLPFTTTDCFADGVKRTRADAVFLLPIASIYLSAISFAYH